MYTPVLAHYARKVGRTGGWEVFDGATYHHVASGAYTLCGYRSDAPGLRQGASERGWELLERSSGYVNCQRCLRIQQRSEHEETLVPGRRKRMPVVARPPLQEAIDSYRPACLTTRADRELWANVFAQYAQTLLEYYRKEQQYAGFQDFVNTDWDHVETGALAQASRALRKPSRQEAERPLSLEGLETTHPLDWGNYGRVYVAGGLFIGFHFHTVLWVPGAPRLFTLYYWYGKDAPGPLGKKQAQKIHRRLGKALELAMVQLSNSGWGRTWLADPAHNGEVLERWVRDEDYTRVEEIRAAFAREGVLV
jgi:hypothetical protein